MEARRGKFGTTHLVLHKELSKFICAIPSHVSQLSRSAVEGCVRDATDVVSPRDAQPVA